MSSSPTALFNLEFVTVAIEGPTEDAWELLNRLHKVYVDPGGEFPAPRGAGWIVRYAVERVGGVGPWAQR